jgi:hypothetical protein
MKVEKSLTALFARALDRFLFGNMDSNGACYHQMTTRKKNGASEASDIYVMRLKENMPHRLVVVGDLKPHDMGKADLESHCYAVTASEDMHGKEQPYRPVIMTLPATLDHIKLNVYTGRTECIEVACTGTTDEKSFKCFSYILFIGVHRLLPHEHILEKFRFKVSCSGEHVPLDEQHPQRKFHRVFKCSGKNIVLKFFDDDLFLPL